jgi:hypothetical protein
MLITTARGVQRACPARRLAADLRAQHRHRKHGRNLKGAPSWVSSLGAKLFLLSTKWCVFAGLAKRPLAPAPSFVALDSIEWPLSMSNLLSSVDPVLHCETNRPTHAPSVLSLAPAKPTDQLTHRVFYRLLRRLV